MQIYLGIPAEGQPPKRLVGFSKVSLIQGASKEVRITIDPAASNHPLGVYDTVTKRFVDPAGRYTVYAGNSSSLRDLKTTNFTL